MPKYIPFSLKNFLILLFIFLFIVFIISLYRFTPNISGDCTFNSLKNYSELRVINNGETDEEIDFSVSRILGQDIGECYINKESTYNLCMKEQKMLHSYSIKCQKLPSSRVIAVRCKSINDPSKEIAIKYNSKFRLYHFNCVYNKTSNGFTYRKINDELKHKNILYPLIQNIKLW